MNSLSRKSLLLASLAALSLGWSASAAYSDDSLFGKNLIKNGDAEASTGSADGTPTEVPSWSKRVGSVFSIIKYGGRADVLQPDSEGPLDNSATPRGANFFCGGNDAKESISQKIDLSSAGGAIDGGKVKYDLSGWLGGYDTQDDSASLRATFLTDKGVAIGVALIGPVLQAERGGRTKLISKAVSGTVPAGTRSVLIELNMVRTSGTLDDGYADNLAFVLNGPGVGPQPSALFEQGGVKFEVGSTTPELILDVTPIECARLSVSSDGTTWFDVGVLEPPIKPINLQMLTANPPTNGRVKYIRVTLVPGAHMSFNDSVLFDTNKANLKPDAQGVLRTAATRLKEIPHARIIVDGHTDNSGTSDYNYKLSLDRAAAVKEFLAKEGVGGATVVRGWGEQRPIAANDTDGGKAQNRRVEIIVVPDEKGFRIGLE